MYTVIETRHFQNEAEKVWKESEREAFVGWISANPLSGDVMKEVRGLRKVRWSRSGMGKSGGARVIYYTQLEDGLLVLLTVYAKSVNDTLSDTFLRRLLALEKE